MLKEKIREDAVSLSQHQPKWRNLWFAKDGRTYYATFMYDTQKAAAIAADEWMLKHIRSDNQDNKINGSGWYVRDIAWHMQMPVL